MAGKVKKTDTVVLKKTDFLRQIDPVKNKYTYVDLVDLAHQYGQVIDNLKVSEAITHGIHYFHHETFDSLSAPERKKRFKVAVETYGVTDFPANLNAPIESHIIKGAKRRVRDHLVESSNNETKNVSEVLSSAHQFLTLFVSNGRFS